MQIQQEAVLSTCRISKTHLTLPQLHHDTMDMFAEIEAVGVGIYSGLLAGQREAARHCYPQTDPVLAWIRREGIIQTTYEALCNGTLVAHVVMHGGPRRLKRLRVEDWRTAAFWSQLLRSGVVRSSACESIECYEGLDVVIKRANYLAWRAGRKAESDAPATKQCEEWLTQLMRNAPYSKPKSKAAYRQEAQERFAVSGNAFNQIWKTAITCTGADWDRHGRPTKKPLS